MISDKAQELLCASANSAKWTGTVRFISQGYAGTHHDYYCHCGVDLAGGGLLTQEMYQEYVNAVIELARLGFVQRNYYLESAREVEYAYALTAAGCEYAKCNC